MTALSIRDAEAALREARAKHGRGSSQGLEAFHALVAAYAAAGRRIDELRYYSPDEPERFLAQTAQGPDGHIYWLGARMFRRNDGAKRQPLRWWWEHKHGPLAQNAIVAPMCGERGCINTEHAAEVPHERRLFSEAQILGALQTAALRLGWAPSKREWERSGMAPSHTTIVARFGSWPRALRAAALVARERNRKAPPADCIAALRLARQQLGHWPAWAEMESARVRAALEAAGLPRRPNTIQARLGGSWQEALRRAGKR